MKTKKAFHFLALGFCMMTCSLAQSQIKTGTIFNSFSSSDLSITIELNNTTQTVRIIFVSNNNQWAALGFDTQVMANDIYTFVDLGDGSFQERSLGFYSEGTQLPTLSTLESTTVQSGVRTTIISRPFDLAAGPSYRTFDFSETSIDMIVAVGYNSFFDYHGSDNKAPEVMAFTLELKGVAINETGTEPDPSAMLDVNSGYQGVLFPRVDIPNLAEAGPVPNPAEGLLVYNTSTNTGVGLHIWNGNEWLALLTSGSPAFALPPSPTDLPLEPDSSQLSHDESLLNELILRVTKLEEKIIELEQENLKLRKKKRRKRK